MSRISLFLLRFFLILGLMCSFAHAQKEKPTPTPVPIPTLDSDSVALRSLYRGDASALLAEAGGAKLTEEQFYVYLLMTGVAPADILDTWRITPGGASAQDIRDEIEAGVRHWARTVSLSEAVPMVSPSDMVGRFRLYSRVYPVEELVWIDRYLMPQVRVEAEDVRKYYDENPDLAQPPRLARVRFLFLKVGAGEADPSTGVARASDADWRRAEDRMRQILDQVHLGNVDFAEAVRKYSEASNASSGGLVPDFSPGRYFGAFDAQAFALRPGQVGDPFRGPQGLYLMRAELAADRAPLGVDQVREEIRRRLTLKQLRARYAYEMVDLRKRGDVFLQASRLDALAGDAPAFSVGRLKMNREELWAACPGFVKDDFRMELGELASMCHRIAGYELMAHFNSRRGWGEDARLRWARDMALRLRCADRRIDDLIRPLLQMTPRQVADFVRKQPDEFLALREPRVTLLGVEISREGRKLGTPHQQYALDRMRGVLEGACAAATSVSLAALSRSWPDAGDLPSDLAPRFVERRLLLAADGNVTVERIASDAIPPAARAGVTARISAALEQVKKGELAGRRFLPVEREGLRFWVLYVEQPDYDDVAILERRWFDLYRRAAATIRREVIRNIEDGLSDSGKLRVFLPESAEQRAVKP